MPGWPDGTGARVVREYECVGGPLDDQKRVAMPLPTQDRIYVSIDGRAKIHEGSQPPPDGWKLLGFYSVHEDETARRGTRERLWWRSRATWPAHVSFPFTIDPPRTDFTDDEG